MASSRIELMAKHPFCPSVLRGPSFKNCSMLCQPRADRLQKAINAGDLPKTEDARSVADFVSAISQGIMLQARGGASRAELHAIVDIAVKALPPAL
jgi:hypothetical protein